MDEIASKTAVNHVEQAERLMAFYEFHDTILEKLDWNGVELKCILNAVCTVSNQDEPLAWGRQRLELRFENAELSGNNVEPEIWLLEGELECDSQDANPIDQIGVHDIAASLVQAHGVRMRLFGNKEGTHDYPRFGIRATSMLIRKLEPVIWDESHLRADLESISRIAIAQKVFDSALI